MKHTELMQAIIQKYEDLIRWLVKYSKPESIRYENYCKELSDLKKQLEECENKNPDSGQAWTCPRCGKVHSWLSMGCDCPPKTITSSTINK